MKKILTIVIVSALILAVVFVSKMKKPKTEEAVFIRKVAYQIAARNDVTLKKECFSKVEGSIQTEVYPDVPGRFVKYYVSEGAFVNKNEPIGEADRSIPGLTYEPTKIVAPISGTVYDLTLTKGDAVMPNAPVAMITNNEELYVRINLSSNYLSMVKVGNRADIIVGEKVYKGYVTRKSKFSGNLTQLGSADIKIDGSHKELINRSCRVYVYVLEKKNVVSVPREAFIEENGSGYIYLFKAGKAVMTPIEYGIVGDDFVEVIKGVLENDTVVTTGNTIINDGQSIRVE